MRFRLLFLLWWGVVAFPYLSAAADSQFDQDRAFGHLKAYMALSPLLPGSDNSKSFALYARSHLEAQGFAVSWDEWTEAAAPAPLRNILATKGSGPKIRIVAAHYDTRIWADKDPDPSKRQQPVPGANDGGSGVAVLLELAEAMDVPNDTTLWLAFFDAEDQGGIPGWGGPSGGWIIGSRRMANSLSPDQLSRISELILLDIIGSPNLRLTREGYSTADLAQSIWDLGRQLGYSSTFLDQDGATVIDDHIPFLQRGIRAVDIIQLVGENGSSFFPWHHTTQDTIDKVDRQSLGIVGHTVETFLETSAARELNFNWVPALVGGLATAIFAGNFLRKRLAVAPARAISKKKPKKHARKGSR